jgi:hypothetical protein
VEQFDRKLKGKLSLRWIAAEVLVPLLAFVAFVVFCAWLAGLLD